MVGVKIFPGHDCDHVIGDTGKAAQKAAPGATGLRWRRAFSAREASAVRRDLRRGDEIPRIGQGLALEGGCPGQDAGQ